MVSILFIEIIGAKKVANVLLRTRRGASSGTLKWTHTPSTTMLINPHASMTYFTQGARQWRCSHRKKEARCQLLLWPWMCASFREHASSKRQKGRKIGGRQHPPFIVYKCSSSAFYGVYHTGLGSSFLANQLGYVFHRDLIRQNGQTITNLKSWCTAVTMRSKRVVAVWYTLS
jgi:hypothetical protein